MHSSIIRKCPDYRWSGSRLTYVLNTEYHQKYIMKELSAVKYNEPIRQ